MWDLYVRPLSERDRRYIRQYLVNQCKYAIEYIYGSGLDDWGLCYLYHNNEQGGQL